MEKIRALFIPPNEAGPIQLVQIDQHGFEQVYELLKCRTVQAIYAEDLEAHGLTAYCDEEGSFRSPQDPCRTAMDYLMPWYGIHHWPGGIVVCGFDAQRGFHVDREPLCSPRLKLVIDESGRDIEDRREVAA